MRGIRRANDAAESSRLASCGLMVVLEAYSWNQSKVGKFTNVTKDNVQKYIDMSKYQNSLVEQYHKKDFDYNSATGYLHGTPKEARTGRLMTPTALERFKRFLTDEDTTYLSSKGYEEIEKDENGFFAELDGYDAFSIRSAFVLASDVETNLIKRQGWVRMQIVAASLLRSLLDAGEMAVERIRAVGEEHEQITYKMMANQFAWFKIFLGKKLRNMKSLVDSVNFAIKDPRTHATAEMISHFILMIGEDKIRRESEKKMGLDLQAKIKEKLIILKNFDLALKPKEADLLPMCDAKLDHFCDDQGSVDNDMEFIMGRVGTATSSMIDWNRRKEAEGIKQLVAAVDGISGLRASLGGTSKETLEGLSQSEFKPPVRKGNLPSPNIRGDKSRFENYPNNFYTHLKLLDLPAGELTLDAWKKVCPLAKSNILPRKFMKNPQYTHEGYCDIIRGTLYTVHALSAAMSVLTKPGDFDKFFDQGKRRTEQEKRFGQAPEQFKFFCYNVISTFAAGLRQAPELAELFFRHFPNTAKASYNVVEAAYRNPNWFEEKLTPPAPFDRSRYSKLHVDYSSTQPGALPEQESALGEVRKLERRSFTNQQLSGIEGQLTELKAQLQQKERQEQIVLSRKRNRINNPVQDRAAYINDPDDVHHAFSASNLKEVLAEKESLEKKVQQLEEKYVQEVTNDPFLAWQREYLAGGT